MSEPIPLQPLVAPPVPTPVGEPGVPCERCGTFIQGEPRKVGVRLLCETCAPLLRKEIRLYPPWYLYVWGILINFSIAAILSALNWKRLGDRDRMRNASIMATFGVAWTVLVVALEFNAGGGLIINIIGTNVAAQGLKGVYEQHEQQGGARANLLWPLLSVLGVFTLLVCAAIAYYLLTGQIPEE